MLVLQILGDGKSPSEKNGEDAAEGTSVVHAHKTRCATSDELPS